MSRLATLTAAAALVAAFFGPSTVAHAGGPGGTSDFALFDGTDPANLTPINTGTTGVLCVAVDAGGNPQIGKSFVFYVSVTNFDSVDREVRVVFPDTDFVRYKIPVGESFSFSQAAGSNEFDVALRVVADKNVSGYVSAQGKAGILCLSCDVGGDGDAACDAFVVD